MNNYSDLRQMVEYKNNVAALMGRSRREIKAAHIFRSPYVSRVVDVNAHTITVFGLMLTFHWNEVG